MAADRGTVVITGSSGLIGAALAHRLDRAYDVVGFDRPGAPHPPAHIECVDLDVTSDESVRDGLRRLRERHGGRLAGSRRESAHARARSRSLGDRGRRSRGLGAGRLPSPPPPRQRRSTRNGRCHPDGADDGSGLRGRAHLLAGRPHDRLRLRPRRELRNLSAAGIGRNGDQPDAQRRGGHPAGDLSRRTRDRLRLRPQRRGPGPCRLCRSPRRRRGTRSGCQPSRPRWRGVAGWPGRRPARPGRRSARPRQAQRRPR